MIQVSGAGVFGEVNRFRPQLLGGWASFNRGATGDQGGKDRRQACKGGALGSDQ